MTIYINYNRICWRCDKRWEAVPRQADWIDIMECRDCKTKQTIAINKKRGDKYGDRSIAEDYGRESRAQEGA